ncbi:MAG TPA: cysteine--tRNA ligase, partial [Pirellulales bacterium]
GMYLCGPTVYKPSHIGHMVGPVIFDAIKRYLVYLGYKVTWVVNITDVDDKLIKESQARNTTMAKLAEEMTADYLRNLESLGVGTIDHFPKATDNIDEIIKITQSLISKGFAYASDGDVYFDVAKDSGYGKLSRRTIESLQGEGGDMAERKRAAADFAIWKSAKPGEPSWDSPWGKGRPGWHIECSAMSGRLLGETFDIHGGGLDLVFPHHENEIAQSECCYGKPMAKYWLHNGLLRADTSAGKIGGRGEREKEADAETVSGKMSRSKGAGGLAELIARQGGERIRFFLLRTQYRSTIVFSEPAIEEAAIGLDTFYRFFQRYERVLGKNFYDLAAPARRDAGQFEAGGDATLVEIAALRQRFLEAMDDDFNTGAAVAVLFDLLRVLNKFADTEKLEAGKAAADKLAIFERGATVLRELGGILGLFVKPIEPAAAGADDALLGKLVQLLIELRAAARKNKDFATGDLIRNRLTEIGITLEDRPGGTEWQRS